MIENTKITLSAKELELVCNTDWILAKRNIIEKVYSLFGNIAHEMGTKLLNSNLPEEVNQTTPKISKGENYLLLPYVMLDYPRYFSGEDIMAVRTLFWWGNSISVHFLVSGKYKPSVIEKLIRHFNILQENDFAVCIADTPWNHHFEKDNYISCKEYSENEIADILDRKPFLKIGKQITLNNFEKAAEFIETSFNEIINLFKD
ncbi:MAG: hypothetical protein V4556_02210 [Bacteroidota bacterium]